MRIHPFMLDNRLSAVAENIIKGKNMVDIGTDHAYLPVWLTRRGICPKALAVDINKDPISFANATIEKYRAADMVETRLSDGFENVPRDFAENIVIAGMGGDAISDILSQCEWIKDAKYNLILQPMTCHERLRKYLYQSGFSILSETIVKDSHRIYTVMKVGFSGIVQEAPVYMQYSGSVNADDANGREYLMRQIVRLRDVAQGLTKAGKEKETALKYFEAADIIEKIITMNNADAEVELSCQQ